MLLGGKLMQGKIIWQQSSTKPENPNRPFRKFAKAYCSWL
jgi:hypothetical protein